MASKLPGGGEGWAAFALNALGFGCVLLCVALALAPAFEDLSRYGGHDWDEMSAHRLFTVKSLLEFGQLPLWMPYACGGFSEWGNVQGATNLVSPWLPAYLALELRHALRFELVGTALVSALGTWLFAGQFTRSPAARTLACLVFVVNGRFALQAATGHLWHLQYCYLPWSFWGFERLLASKRFEIRHLMLGAGALALMVYSGGIYPLPHAVVLLCSYAAIRACLERSVRPLLAVASLGALSVGLSAPKLFAIAADFVERPRLVASTEAIGFDVLWQALVAPDQTPGSRPVAIPQWGWHEYGMYIGWGPALLLGLGLVWPARGSSLALKLTGALALLLGFGAFHELAPWTLLHQVSIFRSQHVPTRWLYPALWCFGVVTASALGRLLEAPHEHRRRFEVVLMAPCLLIAVDIGREASLPMQRAFWMKPPAIARAPAFQQLERVPRELQYQRRDYAPEAVPATLAGVGVIQCTLHASLNIWAPKGPSGRPFGLGARGRGTRHYRGEAFTASGVGEARIVSFSPNRVEVEVMGARASDRVVLNQNFDPGWSVNGRPAEPHDDTLSATVSSPNERLVFEFWPRGLGAGSWVLGATALFLGGLAYRRRASAATFRP